MTLTINFTKVKDRIKTLLKELTETEVMILLSIVIIGGAIGKNMFLLHQFIIDSVLIFLTVVWFLLSLDNDKNTLFLTRGVFVLLLFTVIGNYL